MHTFTLKQSAESKESLKFEKDFGANLQEAVAMFGEETVHTVFAAYATIQLQGVVRRAMDKALNGPLGEGGGDPLTDAQVAKIVRDWTPVPIQDRKVNAVARGAKVLKGLTPEQTVAAMPGLTEEQQSGLLAILKSVPAPAKPTKTAK